MKISANIICKNEIENIHKCIQSIKDICDEIIVIDTGSTDGTLEYLQENPIVKVYQIEWNDNFADMRNLAISKSTGDYILVIDADMTLKEFPLKDLNKDYYVCDIDINGNIFQLVMLFKNDKSIYYTGQRHATIEQSCIGKKGGVSLITFTHPELSREELDRKIKYNLEIHLKQLETEPDNITVNYHLCRTYFYLKDYINAIEYGLKTLQQPLNREVKATTCILIYFSGLAIEQKETAIQFLFQSIEFVPMQRTSRMLLMDFFIEENQNELANDCLEEIELMYDKKTNLPNDLRVTKEQINIYKQKIKEN